MHIFHPDLSHLFTSAAFRSKVYTLLTNRQDKPFLYYTVERQGMWVSKNVMHVQRKICRNIVAQYQIEHAIERRRAWDFSRNRVENTLEYR
ncbi:hypothetical protein X801_01037 [Opisthorchis viverrini]|uniref:Uncharacterized protein n=1 Tax=Opisthorchis viverrini TaxID=6198 RepID=A0A1S8X8K3_OPIVI|nr:hypothetical protein X801_01037 [Opisthorchis viverrini]